MLVISPVQPSAILMLKDSFGFLHSFSGSYCIFLQSDDQAELTCGLVND